jgi:hypothetical protein
MKKMFAVLFLLFLTSLLPAQDMPTPFEQNSNQSATYEQMVAYYQNLAKAVPGKVKLVAYDNGTDIGEPLHLVVISGDGQFNPVVNRQADKRVLLIMNGIHAGEPDGIDASMMLARDLAGDPTLAPILEHIVVLIIPAFNVDGMINRGCCSRANQNGPEQYGFRANACLLNLNRDFSKMDARNTQTFAKIFAEWNPDVFIDTHTSDGADYPATMTYIPTHAAKLNPALAEYMQRTLNPDLEKALREQEFDICPYVEPMDWSLPPDSGISGFMDSPRFSTGYASLFNTIAYTSEAHMLKPFADRVRATYGFCLSSLKLLNRDRAIVSRMRKQAATTVAAQEEYVLRWKLDEKRPRPIMFHGYTATYETSSITGLPMLRYDRERPYTKEIPYYDLWEPELKVKKPVAYLIPQAWREVVERLQLAGVEMKRLRDPASLEVEVYFIDSCKSRSNPSEGHFIHSGVEARKEIKTMNYRPGDYVVFVNQASNRFIVEMLEPEGTDSWFAWNFFDAILDRKEYFSPYAWEPQAQKLLELHPEWKAELDRKKAADPAFAKDEYAQLDFVYRKSEWFEGSYHRYPVTRLMTNAKLTFMR